MVDDQLTVDSPWDFLEEMDSWSVIDHEVGNRFSGGSVEGASPPPRLWGGPLGGSLLGVAQFMPSTAWPLLAGHCSVRIQLGSKSGWCMRLGQWRPCPTRGNILKCGHCNNALFEVRGGELWETQPVLKCSICRHTWEPSRCPHTIGP